VNDLKDWTARATAGIYSDDQETQLRAEDALLFLVAEVIQLRARVAELEVELERA